MSSSESVKHVCVGDDMFGSVCVALTRYCSLMSCLVLILESNSSLFVMSLKSMLMQNLLVSPLS